MTVKCNYCGGTGKTVFTKAKCWHCRGTGILEDVNECKYCGGPCKGYACNSCLGTFEVIKEVEYEEAD